MDNIETTSPPTKTVYNYQSSPRYGSKAKRRGGLPCRQPAIKGSKRCRFHGGRGSGAPKGNNNSLKDGYTTCEAKEFRKEVRQTLKDTLVLIDKMG